jgi:hypothetical protein
MHIAKVISYAGGWNLLNSKVSAMADIAEALAEINKTELAKVMRERQIEWERARDPDDSRFIVGAATMTRHWDDVLKKRQWQDLRVTPNTPGGLRIYIRNFKQGVSSKLICQDRMLTFANWVLIEAPRIISSGACDVAVIVVPMKEIEDHYRITPHPSPVFTFEKSLTQFKDFLPLTQKQPMVVIGFSENPENIEIFDFFPNESESIIERVLEFPNEHYQAGVAILSYFGEILKQKYPDIEAKVRIEQDGNIVRMTVDTTNGDREVIEKTLQDYALVVTNNSPPESLLSDALQIHALNNKLSLAELEIKQTRDLLRISEGHYASKVDALTEEVGFLRGQMSQQMQFLGMSQQLLANQSQKEERLLIAHIESSRRTIDELVTDAWNSAELKNALMAIKLSLESSKVDETEIKQALTVIRDISPSTFGDLSELLKNTVYGVTGNTVFLLLQQISRLLC